MRLRKLNRIARFKSQHEPARLVKDGLEQLEIAGRVEPILALSAIAILYQIIA